MKLLRKLSPNLDRALAALLIGSMVTGVMKNHPTGLQITLGIKMRRSKNLQKYGVTCAYDEVRRLKNLAAKATTMEPSLPGLSTSSSSLVQVIVDNFDTDLILTSPSSPNGKSSTHSLAMLLTQPDCNSSETVQEDTIRRVKNDDMVESLEYDVEIERYNGPKKPPMPQNTPK